MDQIQWELENHLANKADVEYNLKQQLGTGNARYTAFANTILKQCVHDAALEIERLATRKTRGLGGQYSALLQEAADDGGKDNYLKVGYIALLVTLECVYSDRRKSSHTSHIAHQIGSALNEELLLSTLKHTNENQYYVKQYYTGTSLKSDRASKALLARQIRAQAGSYDKTWGAKVKTQVGMRALRGVLTVMDEYLHISQVYENSKTVSVIKKTRDLDAFMTEHTEYLLSTTKCTVPCIELPIPWAITDSGSVQGGFHTTELALTRPFVTTHTANQKKHYEGINNPESNIRAANTLQNVAYTVNTEVLKFVKYSIKVGLFPQHLPSLAEIEISGFDPTRTPEEHMKWKRDKYKVAKINKAKVRKVNEVQRVIRQALRLQDRPLWFVHFCDTRGRYYAAGTGLNPQGPIHVRAMLDFYNRAELGDEGLWWLAIHGANKYGTLSEKSFTDRHLWVVDNGESIRHAAQEPYSSRGRSFLASAKDPFGFYRFCLEWDAAHQCSDPTTFKSNLPIALDGTANGLQHISALLRNAKTAKLVNLISGPRPNSIYDHIGRELTLAITEDQDDNPEASTLLKGGINKDMVKPIVMTLPYGLTRRGMSLKLLEYIDENAHLYDMKDNDLRNWGTITYLTNVLNGVINKELPIISTINDFMHSVANKVTYTDHTIQWELPTGWICYQDYPKYRMDQINVNLLGTRKMLYKSDGYGIDVVKNKNALGPNFIHSLDAAHLTYTILEGTIQDIAAVHDSVAVLAKDIPEVRENLVNAMYRLHENEELWEFKTSVEELTGVSLPDPPGLGEYDIEDVLCAEYFFN